MAWSPNNMKLAVASSDRTIYLFDENKVRKDKFSTKPVESKVYIIYMQWKTINYTYNICNNYSMAKKVTLSRASPFPLIQQKLPLVKLTI